MDEKGKARRAEGREAGKPAIPRRTRRVSWADRQPPVREGKSERSPYKMALMVAVNRTYKGARNGLLGRGLGRWLGGQERGQGDPCGSWEGSRPTRSRASSTAGAQGVLQVLGLQPARCAARSQAGAARGSCSQAEGPPGGFAAAGNYKHGAHSRV